MFIVTIKMQMLGLCGVACTAQRCGSRLITSRIMHQNVTCWRWHCVCVVVSWWINHLIAVVYSIYSHSFSGPSLPTISVLRLIRIENHLDKGSFLYSAYSMPRLPSLHPTVNKVVCSCCAAPIIMSS